MLRQDIYFKTSAEAYKCVSKNKCEVNSNCSDNTGCLTTSSATVTFKSSESSSDISLSISDSQETNVEYLLYDVSSNKFPGITSNGNYAVEVLIEKVNNGVVDGFGTVTLKTTLKDTCEGTANNEIIKKTDGKFYYCAGGIEVLMQEGDAKFAISKDNVYKIVEIGKTKADPILYLHMFLLIKVILLTEPQVLQVLFIVNKLKIMMEILKMN